MKYSTFGKALGLILLSVAGCGKTADSPSAVPVISTQPSPQTEPSPAKPPARDTPAAVFTDEALAQAFKADARATLAKYASKRLEVRGTVWMAGSDNPGEVPKIYLRGLWDKRKPGPEKEIHCELPPSEEMRVAQLAEGQRVTIQGVLQDDAFSVVLTKCELVEVGPSPAIRAGVKQLVADFRMEREKAEKKYEHQSLLVSGTVVLVDPASNFVVHFILKDPADTSQPPAYLVVACPCVWKTKHRARLASVQPGQKVEILGKIKSDFAVDYCLGEAKLLAVSGASLSAASEARQPALVVRTDEELGQELHSDPLAAWIEYAKKRLEVRGVVEQADCDTTDELPCIRLRGHQKSSGSREDLICQLPAAMEEQVEKLARGQRVTIRGLLRKAGQSFALLECELIDIGPSPAVRVTIPELIGAFQQDRKAAQRKYSGKAVLIEGRVSEINTSDSSSFIHYFLRADREQAGPSMPLKVTFTCYNYGKTRKTLTAVKRGQTVFVLGEVATNLEEGTIRVKNARLLK